MTPLVQNKIKTLVEDYQRIFPTEYEQFRKAHRVKVDLQRTKFADVKGSSAIEQLLVEKPETLQGILRLQLSDEEWAALDSKAGLRWFAKTFPQYAVAEAI